MKRYFYTLATLILFGSTCVTAQITISNKNFPVKGDTLKYISLDTRAELNLGNVGGGNKWDFSQFSTGDNQNQFYLDPKSSTFSASYPGANLMFKGGGQEQFLLSAATKIEGLGFTGNNPFTGEVVPVKYSKRPLAFRAPITFGTQLSSNSAFNLDFSASIFPDSLINSLPVKFDSIRIQFTNNTAGFADGWGSIKVQTKTFEAIREKTTEVTETKLFAKIGFIWLDVSSLIGGTGIGGGLGDALGKDTSYYYNFYSDARKEIIFSAQYDRQSRLSNVTYANVNNVITATNDVINTNVLEVYPNPTTDLINLRGLSPNTYIIYIVDEKGSNVGLNVAQVSDNESVLMKVNHLTNGKYFIIIRDKQSNILATKAFIKL